MRNHIGLRAGHRRALLAWCLLAAGSIGAGAARACSTAACVDGCQSGIMENIVMDANTYKVFSAAYARDGCSPNANANSNLIVRNPTMMTYKLYSNAMMTSLDCLSDGYPGLGMGSMGTAGDPVSTSQYTQCTGM